MTTSIIGFGSIGHALAEAFARKNIPVAVANRHDPQSFAAEAAAIGLSIRAATLEDALHADIIFLAVRFEKHEEVARLLPDWTGKIIVDVSNAYGVPPEQLDGLLSSQMVARQYKGARLVKGFNHLVAQVLEQDPSMHGGRRVVFLAGDDEQANAVVADLAKHLGFAPIDLGRLADGGALVHARGTTWGRLIFKDLVSFVE